MATEGKRAESLGRTFDSLRADRVLAPWLIHWLAYLQLARDTVIRHSVMSQCYKYSHAFPTFLSSLTRAENCLPRSCPRNSPFLPFISRDPEEIGGIQTNILLIARVSTEIRD